MKKQVKEYLERVANGESQATKDEFLQVVASHLFCVPSSEEAWPKLDSDMRKAYRAEAEFILKTRLWPWLVNEMKTAAQKKMFDESVSFDDMKGGKFMLYTLDVLEKKLDNISKQ